MSRQRIYIVLSVALVFQIGCSHAPSAHDGGVYHEAAFDDGNRAPASLQPPSNAAMIEDRVDSVSTRTNADYHFSLAEAYSFDGQGEKAIEALKTVLVYDPSAPAVHLRLAAEYAKLGMMTESLESAQTAVKLKPNYPEALLLLGGLYSNIREFDQALKSYQKVLEFEPDNLEAPMYMGAVYAERKDYDKAVKYFERLLKNEEYQSPHLAWYYIGRIRADQGGGANLKLAEKAYKKALEKRPDHADTVLALGQVYTNQEKTTEAIALYKNFQREQGPSDKLAEILAQVYLEQEDYRAALEQLEVLEKRDADALSVKVRIALLLIELKDFPKAINKLTEVLRQVPESDKIRFYLAAVYEETGERAKAIEHFKKVPAGSSFYSESVIHAAYLLKAGKQLNEAIELVTAAMKIKNDVPQLYSIIATLWDEKGDLFKAEGYLSQGLAQFPENVQLNFFLGTIYDRQGKKDQVVQQMRKVINMDSQHVQGLNYLAFTFAELGENLEEAEDLSVRAMEIEPNDGFVIDTYGWVLFKQGKVAKAIPYLEKAHKAQPSESIIAEHLGDAYFKAQLVEKARAMYEHALQKAEDGSRAKDIQQKITSLDYQKQIRAADGRQPASTP